MLQIGTLKSFDSTDYRAELQLAGSMAAYLSNIPVARNIASGQMTVGRHVIVTMPEENPKDACVIAVWDGGAGGGGGGISDHGALSGLADDDHSQYLNTTRHDTTVRHTLGSVVPHESALNNLGDLDVAAPADNDVLYWDNAASKWKAKAAGGGAGKQFYPVDPPVGFYMMISRISSSPRTATISSIATDVITLTADEAYRFFQSAMNGDCYVKICNTSKDPVEYAWVKEYVAANQLKVVTAGDISGWVNAETISTQKAASPAHSHIEVDISLLIPDGATGVFLWGKMKDTNVGAQAQISPAGVGGTWVQIYNQVANQYLSAYPFIPCTADRHVTICDLATGVNTLMPLWYVSGYVK